MTFKVVVSLDANGGFTRKFRPKKLASELD
jgi:hypothetical protein